jgi:predicted metalloprotease with PDZ domain
MLIWDETMAETVARYLIGPDGRDRRMVVMAGGFHVAYGFGIPRRAFRRLPESYAIVLPHTPIKRLPSGRTDLVMEGVTPPQLPLVLGDYAWIVGYDDLEGQRVYLGVRIEKGERGVLVTDVAPNSPGEKAGLKVGDQVVKLGDQTLTEPFDLSYAVSQRRRGETVPLTILRTGETIETSATF